VIVDGLHTAEVKVMTEVPAAIVVTLPEVPIVATAVLLLLQVPELPGLESMVVAPAQMFGTPAIGKEVATLIVVVT
jgi:hypothetical protein